MPPGPLTPHRLPYHPYLSAPGQSVLSRVVNWMIETKPIYGIMKLGAMNAMKSTTHKAGIDWDGHVRRMAATPEVGNSSSSSTLLQQLSVQLHEG